MQDTKRTQQITGIIGSPRKNGNTNVLVSEILSGAEAAGATTQKILLTDYDINPCKACDACRKTGQCIQKDDMPLIMKTLSQSDIWVLGTPVYWWGPTAQFKMFLDRWYGAGTYLHRKHQKVILVIPLGDTNERTARHTLGMLKDSLSYLQMNLVAELVATGVYEKNDAAENETLTKKAFEIGRNAVLSDQ
ncbi:flavodoxin family protein [bacterium]|nr:flavodoxin family protein [candidate division CSSED10-310 bacterium]